MSIILDIAVVVLVAVITIITTKRGFVKSFLNLASLIIAIAVVSSCATPVSEYCYDAFIAPTVESAIESELIKQTEITEGAVNSMFDSLPTVVTKFTSDESLKQSVMKTINGAQDPKSTAHTITDTLIKPPVFSAIKIIVNVILFTVVLIVLRFVSRAICKLFKAPVLNKVNTFFGVVLGIVKGLIISVLVCSVITALANFFSDGELFLFSKDVIARTYIFGKFANIFNLF